MISLEFKIVSSKTVLFALFGVYGVEREQNYRNFYSFQITEKITLCNHHRVKLSSIRVHFTLANVPVHASRLMPSDCTSDVIQIT